MNIADLLKDGADVKFELDGKTHKVKMQPPTAAAARELRDEFYRLGVQVNKGGDNASAEMAGEFEGCIAKVVKACFPPGSAEADMDDDTVRLFVLRIGGDKSEVVKYAMNVCGIRFGDGEEDGDGNDSAF